MRIVCPETTKDLDASRQKDMRDDNSLHSLPLKDFGRTTEDRTRFFGDFGWQGNCEKVLGIGRSWGFFFLLPAIWLWLLPKPLSYTVLAFSKFYAEKGTVKQRSQFCVVP